MKRGLIDWISLFFGRVKRWYGQRPLLLVASLLLIGALVGFVKDPTMGEAAAWLGITTRTLALLLIGFALLLMLISFIRHNRAGKGITPPPPPKEIVERNVFSTEDLKQIRDGLHRELYGSTAPKDEQLERMYRKNPKMGVALYDTEREDFVAFTTAWPLTNEAARRLIAGEMNENALTANDILAAADNNRARFVLVPAFGATEVRRAYLGRDLYYKLCNTLRRNFFQTRNREITLIATGYSEHGQKWCEALHMRPQCHVTMDGKQYPVYARRVTYEDIEA